MLRLSDRLRVSVRVKTGSGSRARSSVRVTSTRQCSANEARPLSPMPVVRGTNFLSQCSNAVAGEYHLKQKRPEHEAAASKPTKQSDFSRFVRASASDGTNLAAADVMEDREPPSGHSSRHAGLRVARRSSSVILEPRHRKMSSS